MLSRIAIIEQNHPALEAIHSAISVEHGLAEVQTSTFFGLEIRHAYIITSRRKEAQQGAPGDVPRPAGSGRA